MIHKISPILNDDSKNSIWEFNHYQINYAIAKSIRENNRMPTKIEIAENTGLSRQTVHKHLKEYSTHPVFQEQTEQFRFMAPKVMSMVLRQALSGDLKAAKLYLEILSKGNVQLSDGKPAIETQNNYIQINNTMLDQNTVKQLSSEQLNQIENILKSLPLGV